MSTSRSMTGGVGSGVTAGGCLTLASRSALVSSGMASISSRFSRSAWRRATSAMSTSRSMTGGVGSGVTAGGCLTLASRSALVSAGMASRTSPIAASSSRPRRVCAAASLVTRAARPIAISRSASASANLR